MQLFSANAMVFSRKFLFFLTPKKLKNGSQKLLIIGPDPFSHSPAQATAHSQKLFFHITKSRDQTSVLLSVPVHLFDQVAIKHTDPCWRKSIQKLFQFETNQNDTNSRGTKLLNSQPSIIMPHISFNPINVKLRMDLKYFLKLLPQWDVYAIQHEII